MPIKVAAGLPTINDLLKERISIMDESRANTQDIRPLRFLILNLMPRKETTELQLLRLLGNTPLQVEVDLMYTQTHTASNTPVTHLEQFYTHFEEIQDKTYDGLIVTGAPVEHLPYQDVDYITELKRILDWSQDHVFSRLFICWGAQYGLNYYWNIDNTALPDKLFGVFSYEVKALDHPFLRGFNDTYLTPQSRHTTIDTDKLEAIEGLEILTYHPTLGADIIVTDDNRDVFLLGHLEYDRDTLGLEYHRDKALGLPIDVPVNYFQLDDDTQPVAFTWRSNAYLFYNNWVNEVYQTTFYDLERLKTEPRKKY